jgi:hypothetical protein
MPGTFTHWMIAKRALDLARSDGHPLYYSILEKFWFVEQGAIGPDYPYIRELLDDVLGRNSWADRMHLENTGAFVACGVQNLAGLSQQDRDVCLAWLCGFATHLVADAIGHPMVNLAVGGIPLFTAGTHRRCEMTQDSWIYHEITKREITSDDYVSRLKLCSDPANGRRIHPALRSFWSKTLRDAHPNAGADFGRIDPDSWHAAVILAFTQATHPVPIFRHIGEAKGLVYQKSTDLAPRDLAAYVKQVKLPGGRTGEFKRDVFDKAVAKVLEVWRRLFVDVAIGTSDGPLAYLPNWDLDRGVDSDALALWP